MVARTTTRLGSLPARPAISPRYRHNTAGGRTAAGATAVQPLYTCTVLQSLAYCTVRRLHCYCMVMPASVYTAAAQVPGSIASLTVGVWRVVLTVK